MSAQPSGGLMQALAPIVARRPVHLIVTEGEAEGTLHVVCQPLRVGNDEDPELGRGFSVEDTPAELDATLPGHVATSWVPARQSLQSVFDQIAAHTAETRQAALRKEKDKGKGKKDGGAGAASAQTLLAPPSADADASGTAPVPAPVSAPVPEAAASAPRAETAPEPSSGAEPALAASAAADGISSLFD